VIRIHITAAAYDTIVAGRSPDSLIDAQKAPQGGFYLWLDKVTLNRLRAARGHGEGYSDTIIRLANEMETT
jgi:hypothetical protein